AVECLLELARNEPEEVGRASVLVEAIRRILHYFRPVPVFFGTTKPNEGIVEVLQSSCGDLSDLEKRWLEKKLLFFLSRFDMEEEAIKRLYPLSRVPADDSPRVIVMDPQIRFGRPTIVEHGTPTDILCERHQAGESITDLAADYDLPSSAVEEAIRYEAKP